uniref:MHD domain-containing protein n=1 Tax=Compsopogon caeruleus TaxID=31354 RepID=A0A6T6CCA5_9RHOD|mmetsp:Transcript_18360/g.38355  ORF Transcript_18360/g.38355 Transcript_18360/m.38355 type:complete len:432 (+) Transcript_18360:101-1396(+)
MSGASGIFIVDGKGKVLISRSFRNDIPDGVIGEFKARVLNATNESAIRPLIRNEEKGYTLCHVQHNNVFFVAVTMRDSNAEVLIAFLYKVVQVFREYFKRVDDESIRDNFVIIYELLDEMMDFGLPQMSESRVLKDFITQGYHVSDLTQASMVATNAISWREEGIRHSSNEVFMDVVETLNITISSAGNVLRSEVLGKILCRSVLSGMPELRLGLNEKFTLTANDEGGGPSHSTAPGDIEDIKFHQCVRLSKFEADRTISFVPPDGNFELMTYRLSSNLKPPVWADCVIEQRASRLDFIVKARTILKSRLTAKNVTIQIPVLPDVTSPKFQCPKGKAKYNPKQDTVDWTIKDFKANLEFVLRGEFSLPSIGDAKSRDESTRRPLVISFEIPYFAVSGLQVKYLKVQERSGYHALPWVRYITKSGDYQIRMI